MLAGLQESWIELTSKPEVQELVGKSMNIFFYVGVAILGLAPWDGLDSLINILTLKKLLKKKDGELKSFRELRNSKELLTPNEEK